MIDRDDYDANVNAISVKREIELVLTSPMHNYTVVGDTQRCIKPTGKDRYM